MIKKILNKFWFIIFGLLLALIFLEISMWIAGFGINTLNYWQNKKNKDPNTTTILCFGESITYHKWPPILQEVLNKKIKNKKFHVIDCGKPGLTTDFFVQNIYKYIQEYNPDIVISMIGISDHGLGYKKYPFKTLNFITFVYEYLKIKYVLYDHTSQSFNRLDSYAIQLWQNGKYEEAEKIYLKLFKKSSYKNNFAYLQLLQLYNLMLKSNNSSEYENKFLTLITNYDIKMTVGHLQEVEKYFIQYKKNDHQIKSWIRKNKHRLEYSDELAFLLKKYDCSDITDDIKKNTFQDVNFIKHVTYSDKQIKEQTRDNYRYIINYICKNNPRIIVMPMQYPTLKTEDLKDDLKDLKYYDKLIFISNEENFKKALSTHENKEIFTDMSGGSFGHCTDYGNMLIAENIAETIQKIIE